MKKLFLLLIVIVYSAATYSQEVLRPLKYNPSLFHQQNIAGSRTIVENRDTLCIPFIDDFSANLEIIDGAATD